MNRVVVVIVSCILAVQADFDPCTDPSVQVVDEPRRNVGNKDSSNSLLCDRVLRTGWYRFHNAEIPFNKCITQYDCGTHVPLWIKGQYPSVADDMVRLTACGDLRSTDNDCCDYNISIAAKNCGTYLTYYLQPPEGCSMSYCTDIPPRCSGAQYSPSGLPPCVDAFPVMTAPPKLSNPVLLPNDFEFQCNVQYPHNVSDGTFEVTWKADDRVLSQWTQTLSGGQRVASLPAEALEGHLNSTLTCSVTSYFTDNRTGGLKSPLLASTGYWVGIEYTEKVSHVDQKSPSTMLTLASTIPIVCRQPAQTGCKLTFAIKTDSGNISTSTCMVSLRPTDWNPNTNKAQTSFTASLLPNIPVSPSGETHVLTNEVLLPGKEWSGVTVPIHAINILSNKPGAQCRSVGDPHYKTFDSEKHTFTDFRVGRFTMVNQLHGSFKIETQTWKPHNMKPSFNCGVAIREGNDVITFSMCDSPMSNPKLEIQNPSMFENHIDIVQDLSGNTYMFKSRSGAVVKVLHLKRHHLNMLNVFITVPGTFMEDTEGLCGYFDGNMDNDYKRSNGYVDPRIGDKAEFVESWRIPTGQSLFEKAEPLPILQQSYCQCDGQTISQPQCGQSSPSVPNVMDLCKDCMKVTPQLTVLTPAPASTSLPALATTPPVNFQTFKPTPIPYSSTSPPSVTSISKIEATQICFTMLNKYPSAVDCISDENQVEFTDVVNMCVKDVELTGDRGMWVSALQTLMEGCAFRELVKMTVYNDTSVMPSTVQSCPGACTGNGYCQNGSCVCESGFAGADCSFNSSALPSLDGISGSVRNCDSRLGDCYSPVMTGSNFQPGATQCYAMDIQFNAEARATVMDTTPYSTPTDFKSSHQVTCHFSPDQQFGKDAALKGFMVTMSNNGGVSLSFQRDSYLIYDSKCLSCDHDNICNIKPDTCLIQNKCYTKGEDVLHVGWCEPQVSQLIWTQKDLTTHVSSTFRPMPSTSTVTSTRNQYTSSTTGCACVTDVNSYECACCTNWGCPCPLNQHSCFDCDSLDMCSI